MHTEPPTARIQQSKVSIGEWRERRGWCRVEPGAGLAAPRRRPGTRGGGAGAAPRDPTPPRTFFFSSRRQGHIERRARRRRHRFTTTPRDRRREKTASRAAGEGAGGRCKATPAISRARSAAGPARSDPMASAPQRGGEHAAPPSNPQERRPAPSGPTVAACALVRGDLTLDGYREVEDAPIPTSKYRLPVLLAYRLNSVAHQVEKKIELV